VHLFAKHVFLLVPGPRSIHHTEVESKAEVEDEYGVNTTRLFETNCFLNTGKNQGSEA
jgi:hypothetical protein